MRCRDRAGLSIGQRCRWTGASRRCRSRRIGSRSPPDAVAFGEVEQVGVLAVPASVRPDRSEADFDGRGGCRCRHVGGGAGKPDGRRAESLEVQVLARDTPFGQRRHQGLHHRRRAAYVELVAAMGQDALEQFDVDVADMLVVRARRIVRPGAAVSHGQRERRVRRRQLLQVLPEGMFAGIAHPVDQVQATAGLLGQAPVQHAHHRRDADACRPPAPRARRHRSRGRSGRRAPSP